MEDISRIPEHVAIILDGNGRWAKAKGMPRNYGHLQGAKAVEDILVDARDLGIKYLTVYAFSTENWNRPESEVTALMGLLRQYLKSSIKKSMKNNVRCQVIGERSKLSDDINDAITELENATKDNTGLTFTISGYLADSSYYFVSASVIYGNCKCKACIIFCGILEFCNSIVNIIRKL